MKRNLRRRLLVYHHLRKQRREVERNRQRMIANLVHEIGRPLGSIRTAIDALQGGAADDPVLRSDLLKGMSERVDRMGRLLEDLSLIYRRLRPQEISLKPVNVSDWVNSLIPLWAESARQKGVHWQFRIGCADLQMTTDPDRLAQALSNLVNNAIKFTPPGGDVSLDIRQEDKRIHFSVEDTGPGIPVEEQPHLFTPFYRTIRPSWKAPGLGLGLSIALSIVEALGGNISFTSVPGRGSTFTISLPIQ